MYQLIFSSPRQQLDTAHISRHRGITHLRIEFCSDRPFTAGLIVLRLQVVVVKIFLQLFVRRVRRSLVALSASAARRGGRVREPEDENNDE